MALITEFMPGVNATLEAVDGGGPVVTLVDFQGRRIIRKMSVSIVYNDIRYGVVNLGFELNGESYGGQNLKADQLMTKISLLGATQSNTSGTTNSSTISFTLENVVVDGFRMTVQNARTTSDNANLYRLTISSNGNALKEVLE